MATSSTQSLQEAFDLIRNSLENIEKRLQLLETAPKKPSVTPSYTKQTEEKAFKEVFQTAEENKPVKFRKNKNALMDLAKAWNEMHPTKFDTTNFIMNVAEADFSTITEKQKLALDSIKEQVGLQDLSIVE
jgi:hypothetical protein